MKNFVSPAMLAAVGVGVVTAFPAQALDFVVEPRFETGAMWYEFDQEGDSRTVGGAFTLPSAPIEQEPAGPDFRVESFSGLKFSDVLPFVGGGATFFVNQFFVDVNAQYAFNGEDKSSFESTVFSIDRDSFSPDVFAQQELNFQDFDADFDRTEVAVSVGYALNENLAFFAGYKRAETNFDTRVSGIIRNDFCGSGGGSQVPCFTDRSSGTFTEDVELDFEHDGPFIGVNFLTNPLSWRFLNGALSGNMAVAFLEGTIEQEFKNGTKVDLDGVVSPLRNAGREEFEGDSIGLSAGVTWRGTTPVQGLSYSIGINGYTYRFDGEGSDPRNNFRESLVNFKAGIAYLFDI